ncbi:MAG: ubiquinol-cytochrome c reductase cytochrome c subunit, partial [Pseudonocardiales bacterium]|nr:ubiquinol-cytochrome c reductase cytochrome c subunit [Pseudonocardiales bacterium]
MNDDHVDADSGFGFEPAVSDGGGPSSDGLSRPAAKTGSSGGWTKRPSRRRSGLARKLTSAAVLVGALAAVGGGYALLAPSSGAADTALSAQDVEKGRQLFETSCITCHGANLQGVQGRGPSLIGVGSASAYFQVSTGRMPAAGQGANNLRKTAAYNEQETLQIAAYVQSVGGGPQVPTGDLKGDPKNISQGGELFRLNC